MGHEVADMLARFQRHPEAFAKAHTPAEFCDLLGDTGDAGVIAHYIKVPDTWTYYLWRQAKAQGLDTCTHRVLYMPEAKRLSEIVEDVRFLPQLEGGGTRDEYARHTDGRVYLSGHRASGIPCGTMGGKRDWSPDWLTRGEKVRRHMGGKFYGTYARPTAAAQEVFAKIVGGTIGGLEFVRWDDGRTLTIARDKDSGIFQLWLALLAPGECDAMALMSDGDRKLYESNKAADLAAWGEE